MKISYVISFIVGCAVSQILWHSCHSAKAQEDLHTANNVFQVYVTDYSKYTVDKRYNICFYEVITIQGASVVYIPQEQCHRILKTEKGE